MTKTNDMLLFTNIWVWKWIRDVAEDEADDANTSDVDAGAQSATSWRKFQGVRVDGCLPVRRKVL
jgi:hypothetical protein